MKILNCSQRYHVKGGSDKYFFDISELLRSAGNLVVPFCASSAENLPTSYDKYFPVDVDFNNPSVNDIVKYVYNSDANNKLNILLNEIEIDIAHLHIYYGKLSSSILSVLKKRQIPIIQTLHEYKLVCPVYTMISHGAPCYSCRSNAFYMSLIKKCNRGQVSRSLLSMIESYASVIMGSQSDINCFIAVSDFQKKEIIKMGVDENKIHTVHNFVDSKQYKMELNNEGYFLYFGRVEKIKGIDVLLQAFEQLRDIQLLVVGDGSYLESAIEYCREHKILNIEFVGHVSHEKVKKYIEGAIAVIAPSIWYETFGLTLVESMSTGKPVIASDIGGMQEIVSHGSDGYLVEPGNVAELIDKVRYLSTSPHVVCDMGRNARVKVEQNFSPTEHLEKLKLIYSKYL